MSIDELIKQAPYLAAIVIIVWAFLRAQEKRDEMFLKAQADRDVLFMKQLQNNTDVVSGIATDVQKNTEILITHDTKMQTRMSGLTRTRKADK